MQEHSKSSRRAALLACVVATVLACAAAGAQEAWHYVLNETQPARQANFCASEGDVQDMVKIFERFGPRTGYTALAESDGCYIAVQAFTPRRVIREVVIAEGKPEEYRMRFVEVHNADGEVLYLVTTREVKSE